MIRAIREKLKGYHFAVARVLKVNPKADEKVRAELRKLRGEVEKRLKQRLTEIQSWLNLEDETVQQWLALATGMNAWLSSGLEKKTITSQELLHKFPVLWGRYLAEKKKSDIIEVKIRPVRPNSADE